MVKPVRRPDRATRARARDRRNRAQAAGRSEYRLDSRRLAILDAAEQLFLEKGSERAELSEVIRRSGGSLAILYAFFGNQEVLVGAGGQRALEHGGGACRAKGCGKRERLVGVAEFRKNKQRTG